MTTDVKKITLLRLTTHHFTLKQHFNGYNLLLLLCSNISVVKIQLCKVIYYTSLCINIVII